MKRIALISLMIFTIVLVGCKGKKEEVVVDQEPVVTSPSEETQKQELVDKLNPEKGYVYNAEYEKNVEESHYLISDTTYYVDSIVVPYINIDSEAATKANVEIKEEFDKVIKWYNEGAKDGNSYVDVCTYTKYEDSDMISVLFYYGLGATDVVHPVYYGYNINLKDGSVLSFNDVYRHANINPEEITKKVNAKIVDTMNEKMSSFSEDERKNYIVLSEKAFMDAQNKGSLVYCLNESGKLEVVVNLNIPAGTGEFDTLLEIE